ncbi:hypothetical protein CDD83_1400 [Cordyceps sp. RAO-2017]|nr:hypothetical protein CDD83_1400 [Cordyceps sp. RAO-2017]
MREYQYQPLQPGEIRLLCLHPVESPGQGLQGSILHHTLTNPIYRPDSDNQPAYLERPQSYEAISYHWGTDTRTPYRLLIHDRDGHGPSVIRLTAALHTVLRRLALPDRERVLWADAICINQVTSSSNEEKGIQIQLMPDIYRIASRVQIYLGSGSDDLALALDLLATIADYSEYLDDKQHTQGEIGTALAVESGLILPPPDDKRWQALRAFLRRPWFRRVWVIQEFVYAADIVVVCGDHEVDWHQLWLGAKAYVDNRDLIFAGYKADLVGTKRLDEFREAHEGARALLTIADLRMRAWGYMSPQYMILSLNEERSKLPFSGLSIRKDLNAIKKFEDLMRSKLLMDRASGDTFPFGQPDMLELLHRTNNFLATQPVDRLYALLGLADDTGHLQPIYSRQQTLPVVTTRFAASFIRKGRLADILATAGIRSNVPSADDPPSWVPHWTKVTYAQDGIVGFNRLSEKQERRDRRSKTPPADAQGQPTTSNPDSQGATGPGNQQEHEKLYHAALDTAQDFVLDEAQGTLSIKAVAVSRVVSVLPGKLLYGTVLYAHAASRFGQVYPTGEPMEEALWRTLIGNRTFYGEAPPPDYAEQYQNLKQHDTQLLVRSVILAGIACLVALPVFILAIRLIPLLGLVAILVGLVATKRVPLAPSVVLLCLLPVFRWLWIMALVPVLIGLTWYGAAKVYPLQALEALAKFGLTTAGRMSSMPTDCSGYLTSFSIMGNRYSLCVTEHRLMGLLPLLTQVGDIVVVFLGCNAPFVIRPAEREGCYRLVGECYVHGIMNGECMVGEPVDITLL